MLLVAVIAAAAAVVTACFAWRMRSGAVRAMLAVVALLLSLPGGYVLLALHPEWVDARFRTYKAFYRDIEIGMTREEVLAAMERRYPANGARKRPRLWFDSREGMSFFMDPERSTEPNCEGIFVTLESGRVAQKRYSPD